LNTLWASCAHTWRLARTKLQEMNMQERRALVVSSTGVLDGQLAGDLHGEEID
jgi:hypothetical protein